MGPFPPLWPEICMQTKETLLRNELFHEDATPYLYVKELIEGVRTNTEIRYVFVDEGQDYSSFQYEYLKKLFPRARMTVLGDFGQAIFMQSTSLAAPIRRWSAFLAKLKQVLSALYGVIVQPGRLLNLRNRCFQGGKKLHRLKGKAKSPF